MNSLLFILFLEKFSAVKIAIVSISIEINVKQVKLLKLLQ